MKALLALAAASLFALAACGGPSVAAGATGGTVNVNLSDMKITVNRDSVPAGQVTFSVKNVGAVTHEIVVIKLDGTAYDAIPADPQEAGQVSEDGSQGESGDLEPGASKTFTLNLDPGAYALICNQPGHYMAGMRIPFTVTK